MLTNVFKVLVNNPFKKSFYEKEKKQLMFLQFFYLFFIQDKISTLA